MEIVFPHSLACNYKNSSNCTFLFLLYGNLVPEFVWFTGFEREFRCCSNFFCHLQEHSLPSNCLPKQKPDWKAGVFFCFVICSLQTHLLPESGHHCKLLQSLRWLGTVFVTMQCKIAKDLEAFGSTGEQIELPPIVTFKSIASEKKKQQRQKLGSLLQSWWASST